jgi:hypothetical protein
LVAPDRAGRPRLEQAELVGRGNAASAWDFPPGAIPWSNHSFAVSRLDAAKLIRLEDEAAEEVGAIRRHDDLSAHRRFLKRVDQGGWHIMLEGGLRLLNANKPNMKCDFRQLGNGDDYARRNLSASQIGSRTAPAPLRRAK